ncbi:MAG: hydrogenase maturation nickel metallochaperone HypA [Bacteroidales bacterium]|nr:hydrogenase maturation nickel metallochaperone HypA [Bacteroidales bacterium]
MHELSVAQNIIEIVEENARKLKLKIISEVEIDVGTISGVVPENLEFAMDVAMKDTILENAKIKMNIIKAKAKCLKCANEFEIEEMYSLCPKCNRFEFEIINGKELKVKSIKAE